MNAERLSRLIPRSRGPLDRSPRRAFTLVELLVVIAIIGVLVALLLPAVQQAREASRRASCVNNLKQLALAVHGYHDAYTSFPAGGTTAGACCDSKSYHSWTIVILPFMERNDLYDLYAFNLFNEDPPNRQLREKYVPTFGCPSEANPGQLLVPDSGPAVTAALKYRTSNYRGVSGRSDGNGWWDTRQYDSCCGNPASANYLGDPVKQLWKGIFHNVDSVLSQERIATVLDGTSNTLMLGEFATRTKLDRSSFWAYSYASYNKSAAVPQARTLLGDYDKCVKIGGAGADNSCKRGWGSYHPNVLQFSMADASVRQVRTNIDLELFCRQATIAGAEPVQE